MLPWQVVRRASGDHQLLDELLACARSAPVWRTVGRCCLSLEHRARLKVSSSKEPVLVAARAQALRQLVPRRAAAPPGAGHAAAARALAVQPCRDRVDEPARLCTRRGRPRRGVMVASAAITISVTSASRVPPGSSELRSGDWRLGSIGKTRAGVTSWCCPGGGRWANPSHHGIDVGHRDEYCADRRPAAAQIAQLVEVARVVAVDRVTTAACKSHVRIVVAARPGDVLCSWLLHGGWNLVPGLLGERLMAMRTRSLVVVGCVDRA